MAFLKVMVLVMLAVVASRAEPQGQPYLPPKQEGYTYPTPGIPFTEPNTPRTPVYPGVTKKPTSPVYPGVTKKPTVPVYPGVTKKPTGPDYPFTGTYPTPPTQPPYKPSGTGNVPTYNEDEHLNHPHVAGKPYDFNYAVKDDYYGTDYSRNEVSDGNVITGEYRVQLPDGRLQIVRYTADWKTGYHADVSYEGQAQYPQASNPGPYQAPNQTPYQAPNQSPYQAPYQAPSGPAPAYGAPASGGNRGGY